MRDPDCAGKMEESEEMQGDVEGSAVCVCRRRSSR